MTDKATACCIVRLVKSVGNSDPIACFDLGREILFGQILEPEGRQGLNLSLLLHFDHHLNFLHPLLERYGYSS